MFFQKYGVSGQAPLQRTSPLSDPVPFSPPRSRKTEEAPKKVKEAHSVLGFELPNPNRGPFTPRESLRYDVGNGATGQLTLPESKPAIWAPCRKTTVSRT